MRIKFGYVVSWIAPGDEDRNAQKDAQQIHRVKRQYPDFVEIHQTRLGCDWRLAPSRQKEPANKEEKRCMQAPGPGIRPIIRANSSGKRLRGLSRRWDHPVMKVADVHIHDRYS